MMYNGKIIKCLVAPYHVQNQLKKLFSKNEILPSDDNLIKLRQKGLILQKLNPNYSWCHRCYHPWNHCNGSHSVKFSHNQGHFALCETCWGMTTTEEKIMYYTECYHEPNEKKLLVENILKECGEDPVKYFREKKLKRLCK